MAESAIFYNYAGDPRNMYKSMYAVYTTATIKPLEPLDDLRARIVIDYAATVDGCNYFRYSGKLYHIESRERLTGGAMSVAGLVDALTTYAAAVASCPAIAARNAQQWDMWRGDSQFKLMQKKNVDTIDLGSIGEGDAIIFGYVE